MWSKIPIIGWLLGVLIAVSSAIPFYYMWNYVAPIYFYQLPTIYQNLPFWGIVYIFLTISILRDVFIGSSFKTTIKTKEKTKQN